MMKKAILGILPLMLVYEANAANLFEKYTEIKQQFSEEHHLNFGLDTTLTWQYAAPSGHHTILREFITPYASAEILNNQSGKGELHFLLNIVHYNSRTASDLSNKIGIANQLNSYDTNYNELLEFYYEHQVDILKTPLRFGLGQFPICNFDGPIASDLQQQYFLNNAISQNGTFAYPSAGLGGYLSAQIKPEINFSIGAIDATNPTANGAHAKNLHQGKFSSFAALNYTPKWRDNQGSYSLMIYDKPSVSKAPDKVQGLSFYLAQDISNNHSIFFRYNTASGSYTILKETYAVGLLWNNPFHRQDADQLAMAYAINKVNNKAAEKKIYHHHEQVLETYYDYRFKNNFAIRPDVQFYINPAFHKKSDYATAFSLSLYAGF